MQQVAEIKVRYAETDAMGIAYHANYLVWMEVARTELFRALGLPYSRFESAGLSLAVVDAKLRYKAAAKYDDSLHLLAELLLIKPRKVVFQYQIKRQDLILCEGETAHIFINKDGRATNAADYPIWQEVQRIFNLK